MNILAIETSCDDTGVAVIKKTNNDISLLSNVVSSQIKVHQPYGGVVPNLAARAHLKNIKLCLEKSLKQADNINIDLIAVTKGPGLIPCLQIGVSFAKAIAYAWQKPIIGINHIEGHIYANWLSNNKIKFPVLCLVVSGGHTQLVLMKDHGKYQLLGQTRDDAAGEAFDKVAKLLKLGYPGGPIISQRAEKGEKIIKLPRPMIYDKNFDFSFSGLKTAVLYEIKKKKKLTTKYVNDMSSSFQQAVIDVLIHKTIKAAEKYNPKTILLAGGVIANKELRKQIQERISNIEVKTPEIKFCTDNAAMIAVAACFNKKNQHWSKLNADSNLKLDI
ncbi:tRNA (adenosine(37)-N6)-threonylcarbamoyltransferase complex transferase subunit TsaD [Patescibacteria group bacterium]